MEKRFELTVIQAHSMYIDKMEQSKTPTENIIGFEENDLWGIKDSEDNIIKQPFADRLVGLSGETQTIIYTVNEEDGLISSDGNIIRYPFALSLSENQNGRISMKSKKYFNAHIDEHGYVLTGYKNYLFKVDSISR